MDNLIPNNYRVIQNTVYTKDYDSLDDSIKWCIEMGIYDLKII